MELASAIDIGSGGRDGENENTEWTRIIKSQYTWKAGQCGQQKKENHAKMSKDGQ